MHIYVHMFLCVQQTHAHLIMEHYPNEFNLLRSVQPLYVVALLLVPSIIFIVISWQQHHCCSNLPNQLETMYGGKSLQL